MEKKKSDKGTTSLPIAPFGLTTKQMEEAYKHVKEIRVPAGDHFCPSPIFSRISRLNLHEWKEVTWQYKCNQRLSELIKSVMMLSLTSRASE